MHVFLASTIPDCVTRVMLADGIFSLQVKCTSKIHEIHCMMNHLMYLYALENL